MTGLAIAVMSGCGSTHSSTQSQSGGLPTAFPSASGTGISGAALKPMIGGLIDRSGPPPAPFASAVTAFVVNVNWSDLQPSPGAPLAAGNAIDQAITQVRQMNAAAGSNRFALKIRPFAGLHAPEWAKQLGGAPVDASTQGVTGTIGRFWTDQFGQAYMDFWTKLAARYDSVPEIREITVSRCTTVYAESFQRGTSDPVTVSNLLSAGFTVAADHACIQQEIDLGKVWKTTRIGVAFNPYQEVVPGVRNAVDEAFTEEMMSYCRTQLGPQCVLENNSIRYPPLSGTYAEMYAAMRQLGPPISFQTASAARIGDLAMTLQWAAAFGANAVELPAGYDALPPTTLSTFATALAANPS